MSLATEPPCKELDIRDNIYDLEKHVKNALKGYYEYLDWLKEDSTIAFFGGMTEDSWINLCQWTSDKINAAEHILKNIKEIKDQFGIIRDIEFYEGDGETEKEKY